ncbi:hypothetical protein [Saccharibacillus qingshengii]|uniref:hypothetical protein n=1 Tax=Saccharibacillus qingshengii TaxID=1763540 RepID=UPI001553F81A|nr:hypothetical protein [Saccharibacillus qingshengii]
MKDLKFLYDQIGKLMRDDPIQKKSEISELFEKVYLLSWDFLLTTNQIPLISKIKEKTYFSFLHPDKENKISRAVNKELFIFDAQQVIVGFRHILAKDFENCNSHYITKVLYTIAISFCANIDLKKEGDQKTPGTFFEFLIRHMFSHMLNIEPRNRVDVLNLDMKTTLPTDFIYDLGPERPKIHLPVKTSTRERVIQVWAHQRVLDGVYGTGRFMGMLTCLSETKVDKTKREVTEICLPKQWRIYQMFIAQLQRVYYLDPPTPYLELNNIFPPINVRSFGEFFTEVEILLYENKL